MAVDAISFSAHADYDQTHGFVAALAPPHVVLVHGEAGEMMRLRTALERAAVTEKTPRKLHTPRVVQTVSIALPPRRAADVVGRLAEGGAKAGEALRGVLISRGRRDLIMHPGDLPEFTKLNTGRVTHKQVRARAQAARGGAACGPVQRRVKGRLHSFGRVAAAAFGKDVASMAGFQGDFVECHTLVPCFSSRREVHQLEAE